MNVKEKRIRWDQLIICILIPLAVGTLSGLISQNAWMTFENVQKPPLSPPGWLFPVVWTVLYILMGIASYLIIQSDAPADRTSPALLIYGIQLFFNFFWSILFFNLEWYLFSFFWLLVLWGLILLMMILFYRIHRVSAYLLIPYLLWVTFAGYLNLGIYLVN